MGYIEIFRMNENGAGWVDLSEATPDELFDIEVGLLNPLFVPQQTVNSKQ